VTLLLAADCSFRILQPGLGDGGETIQGSGNFGCDYFSSDVSDNRLFELGHPNCAFTGCRGGEVRRFRGRPRTGT
jgi:hypothetical protein